MNQLACYRQLSLYHAALYISIYQRAIKDEISKAACNSLNNIPQCGIKVMRSIQKRYIKFTEDCPRRTVLCLDAFTDTICLDHG